MGIASCKYGDQHQDAHASDQQARHRSERETKDNEAEGLRLGFMPHRSEESLRGCKKSRGTRRKECHCKRSSLRGYERREHLHLHKAGHYKQVQAQDQKGRGEALQSYGKRQGSSQKARQAAPEHKEENQEEAIFECSSCSGEGGHPKH